MQDTGPIDCRLHAQLIQQRYMTPRELANMSGWCSQAVSAMQPRGAVLLAGCSVAGCTIAAAMAAALQAGGRSPLLILLDGCPAPLSETALHKPAW